MQCAVLLLLRRAYPPTIHNLNLKGVASRSSMASVSAGTSTSAPPQSTNPAQNASGAPVYWEWLEEGPIWVAYDQASSAQLEAAFTGGSPNVQFGVSTGGRHRTGAQYVVDLDSMMQVNQFTGFTRCVRRYVAQCSAAWEWEGNQPGAWQRYPPEAEGQMEAALAAGRAGTTLHLLMNGGRMYGGTVQTYTVDLGGGGGGGGGGGAQTFSQVRLDTGRQRRVRRTAGAGGAAAAAAAAAAGGAGQGAAAGSSTGGQDQAGGALGLSADKIDEIIANATCMQEEISPDESCSICLDEFFDEDSKRAMKLEGCQEGHYFHAKCAALFLAKKPECPMCKHRFAEITGDQPDGTMTISTQANQPLPGFPPNSGTIILQYHFPSGIQGPQHPNPGQPYSGTSRTAYLPDTAEGREVLGLLRRAFDRRLVFRVGQSVTTGRDNATVWNGIHHKTRREGGPQNFGYPDQDYLHRVKDELRSKGIE